MASVEGLVAEHVRGISTAFFQSASPGVLPNQRDTTTSGRLRAGAPAYCVRPRMEAGWPGSLSFLPVSVIVVPSTLRMDTSLSV